MQPFDRIHLRKAWELAHAARQAPEQEFSPLEPTWAAVIAKDSNEMASAICRAGDSEDAVLKAMVGKNLESGASLYISIEPTPTFQRLAPVTETIRKLGFKRVVVGAENPAPRQSGKGIDALRKLGIEVVMADGEEARLCQLLLEDFAKVMRRGLPQLRLYWQWDEKEPTRFPLDVENIQAVRADAFLVSHATLAAQKKFNSPCAWTLLLDADGESFSAGAKIRESKTIVFTRPGIKPPSNVLHFPIELRDGVLDLALVLRKAADLGLFSVLCAGDLELFQRLLQAGLVDTVISQVDSKLAPAEIMAKIAIAPVETVRLTSPRLVEQKDSRFWIEAEVNIAN